MTSETLKTFTNDSDVVVQKRDYCFSKTTLSARGSNGFTRAKIIRSLQEFANLIGSDTFTFKKFEEWPDKICRGSTASRHFGSWPEALKAAGLRPSFIPQKTQGDYKKMVELYMDCWQYHDSKPTENNFKEYLELKKANYSALSVKRHFGGWERLRSRIVNWENGFINDKTLLAKHSEKIKSRRAVTAKMREAVFKRNDNKCVLCGKSPSKHGIAIEVDHIHPISKGGGNEIENLQTLCEDCNAAKSDSVCEQSIQLELVSSDRN